MPCDDPEEALPKVGPASKDSTVPFPSVRTSLIVTPVREVSPVLLTVIV